VIGVAILAELLWLVGHAIFSGPRVFAATPRALAYQAPTAPTGGDVLADLAAAAGAQPALTRTARTTYAYVKTVTWQLDPQLPGRTGPSRVLPTLSEKWTAPDGAGRVITVTATRKGSSTADTAVPAGEALPALSTNQAMLSRSLALGAPATDGAARRLIGFAQLASRRPISPRVESAILRLLARIPGLTDAGTVTDRDGRPGIAVSLALDTGVDTDYTLIFDERTGMLLGEEETLIGSSKRFNVRPGSVIAYTTLLTSGYVANTTTRP